MNHRKLFHAISDKIHFIRPTYILAVCWMLGLVLGMIYGYQADPIPLLMMRIAAAGPTTIVGLLVILYFPLLLSALAVYRNHSYLLILICFLKAFLIASCGSSLNVAFGSSAWLVRFFLQFADLCSIPFFYWFCIRNITGRSDNTQSDILICGVAMTICGIIDFCAISPLLVKFIDV